MKLQSLHPSLRSGGLVPSRTSPKPEKNVSQDGFQLSERTPPVWKKMVNGMMVSLGCSAAAATVVALATAAGQGSAALGAPILGGLVGGPIGLVAGAVAGWKNCTAEKASLPRKLFNAATWGLVGAGSGAILSLALGSAVMQGPDSLAALSLAPAGALLGAGGAAVAGWNLAGGQ